jgi:ATP-binding cassette subfamily F protein uup
LSKRFGDKVLLDHFTYTFKRSDRVGLIGKNGMGKTTLMNMLTGQLASRFGKNLNGWNGQVWLLYPNGTGFTRKSAGD